MDPNPILLYRNFICFLFKTTKNSTIVLFFILKLLFVYHLKVFTFINYLGLFKTALPWLCL